MFSEGSPWYWSHDVPMAFLLEKKAPIIRDGFRVVSNYTMWVGVTVLHAASYVRFYLPFH